MEKLLTLMFITVVASLAITWLVCIVTPQVAGKTREKKKPGCFGMHREDSMDCVVCRSGHECFSAKKEFRRTKPF